MKNRTSPRRKEYNYASPWVYFITICTKNRVHYFGEIKCGKDGKNIMKLSEVWKQTHKCRLEIPNHYPFIKLHEFICMPNHIHILLGIYDGVGTQYFASKNDKYYWMTNECHPTRTDNNPSLPNCASWSLGSIIRWFKIGVTKFARQNNIWFERQWRYHDHIVRNQQAFDKIKYYIQMNVEKRDVDCFK